KRLKAQPPSVVEEVVAGLEAWMLQRRQQKGNAEKWQRLLRLANQLDANERRREIRGLLGSEQLQREWVIGELSKGLLPWSALWGPVTGKARQQLAHRSAAVNPRREPVLGLVSLARALKEAGNAGEAERVLRLSLAARPDQVVLLEA